LNSDGRFHKEGHRRYRSAGGNLALRSNVPRKIKSDLNLSAAEQEPDPPVK